MSTNAGLVIRLRKHSGFPINECRKALIQSGNCFDGALNVLDQSAHDKLLARIREPEPSRRFNLVSLARNDRMVAAMKLAAETESVVRTPAFSQFAALVAKVSTQSLFPLVNNNRDGGVFATEIAPLSRDNVSGENFIKTEMGLSEKAAELLGSSTLRDFGNEDHSTVKGMMEHLSMRTGELIALKDVACIPVPENGVVGDYIHTTTECMDDGFPLPVGSRAAAVTLTCEDADPDLLRRIAYYMAAQVAIGEPSCIRLSKPATVDAEGVGSEGDDDESGEVSDEPLMSQEWYLYPRMIREVFPHSKPLMDSIAEEDPQLSVEEGLSRICRAKGYSGIAVTSFFCMTSRRGASTRIAYGS